MGSSRCHLGRLVKVVLVPVATYPRWFHDPHWSRLLPADSHHHRFVEGISCLSSKCRILKKLLDANLCQPLTCHKTIRSWLNNASVSSLSVVIDDHPMLDHLSNLYSATLYKWVRGFLQLPLVDVISRTSVFLTGLHFLVGQEGLS